MHFVCQVNIELLTVRVSHDHLPLRLKDLK